MVVIASFLSFVLWLFVIVTLVRVAFSWFNPYPNNPIYRVAFMVTEPVLGPVRRLLPPVSGMDLSPLVVTVACYFLIHALGYVGG
jgi:YggT family protein